MTAPLPPPTGTGAKLAPVPGRVSSPRVIGRANELARFDELFTAADEDAQSSVFVLSGDAGIGKSRLVAEFVDRVDRRGGFALVGACLELVDRSLPYAPVVEALRQLVRRLDPARLDAVLGQSRHELSHLLPELDPEGGADDDNEHSQRRLFEHVLGVLERLGEQTTTVLVMEDMHWADLSTLDLLVFLARNLRDTRAIVVATYRSDELHRRHPLRPVLAELDRSGRVERRELERFTRNELRDLILAIRDVEPDDELLDDILARSEGNAFFAEELLAAGDCCGGSLPQTLRDLLLARIDALPDDARDVLRIAAVIGTRIPHALLTAVRGTEPDDGDLDAVRACVEHQVLVAEDWGYRFRHALVQEAVYDDLLPGERSEMHACVAKVLAAQPSLLDGRAGDVDAELACHWFSAHELPNALQAAVRAAEGARQMYAYPEALAHLQRALDLWDRVPDAATLADASHVDILRRAANVADITGRQDLAVALARRALDEVDETVDPITAALVHERLARFLWMHKRPFAEVVAHNEAAVALVPSEPPSAERALVEAALGQQLMLHDYNAEALRWCEAAIRTARQVGEKVIEGHAHNSHGTALAHLGAVDRGLDELYVALDMATASDSWLDVARATINISGVLQTTNRYAEAVEVAQAGLAEVEARGLSRGYGAFLRASMVETLFELGRWSEADEQLRIIERACPTGIDALHRDEALFTLLMHRGDLDGAQVVHDRMRHYSASIGARRLSPYQRGALAVARGELDEAQALLDQWLAESVGDGGDRSSEWEQPEWLIVELLAATADACLDDPEFVPRAVALGETLCTALAPREHLDVVRLHQPALRALAAAEIGRARGEHDPEAWSQVADLWERCSRAPHVAYARWRQGEAAVRGGFGAAAARGPLRMAFDLADEMGAAPIRRAVIDLASRARVDLGLDLDAVGPRAPAVAGLTAREAEVIELVAQGRTNRQIAEALFISVKTASVHVSNILMKLGAQNRGEAAARARELGLLDL